MSATKVAPQINRKQTRAEVDRQIQKSIPMYLQAALWKCFERMFGKHTLIESLALRWWGDVSLRDDPVTGNERLFLKVGSSRTYQDYDQEQGEHPVQPGAMRLNKLFAKYRPSEAKKPRPLWKTAFYCVAVIAVVILQNLTPSSIPLKACLYLINFIIVCTLQIMIFHESGALPLGALASLMERAAKTSV